MKHTLRILCVLFSFATTTTFAATYIVKKGDTLANIARKRYGEPVFGPKGTINKILKQNPDLKMNVPLEPGQKINLETGTAQYPAEKVPNAKPTMPKEPVIPLPPKEPKLDTSPFEQAAHQMDMMPRGPMKEVQEKEKNKAKEKEKDEEAEEAKVEVIPKAEKKAAAQEAQAEHAAAVEESHHAEYGEHTPNYFSFIPQYSMVTQTASEGSETFTMHSSPAIGAELGWDHWWNSSFSTVFTVTALQFTSKEASQLNGTKVLNKLTWREELALLNRVCSRVRLGLGIANGDHFFLMDFPADAKTVKVTYLNAFAAAEITAMERANYEVLLNLKIAQLPAQAYMGHPILAGWEYMGQISLQQKMAKFSMLYGIAWSAENQTLSDATESRQEWALKIGALF